MRWPSIRLLALALTTTAVAAVSATHASARPPNTRTPPPAEPTTENEKVEAAIRAWSSGNWAQVRILLEPLIQGDRNLADPLLNETALRYLADATLQDEATLDAPIRNDLATGYIQRLLASSDVWRPPLDLHGKQFYALYNTLREQRDTARARVCIGELASCDADKAETSARLGRLQSDYALLKAAFDGEEVEVREKVARNRAVALIPFGVGHFYNGRKGLGAAFLASELAFGGVGIGLFIARSFVCSREGLSFKPGALTCQGEGAGLSVVRQRNAEQTMGLLFLGTVALDSVLAQVTFRPFLTVKSMRVPRHKLDQGTDDTEKTPRKRPGKAERNPSTPTSRARTRDILQVSPAPAYVPGGAGFGVSLRF